LIKQLFKNWIWTIVVVLMGITIGHFAQYRMFDKYLGSLMSDTNQLLADGQKVYFVDVDKDGNSEEFIYYHIFDSRQPVINQYSSGGAFERVWYLEGEIVENFDVVAGDYNNDSINEVFVFSKIDNAIYLYGLDSFDDNKFVFDKQLVCEVPSNFENRHIVIHSGGMADLNKDGFKELIFSVNSRFSASPRAVFSFDIENKHLTKAPELGVQLVGSPILYDIDADGSPEIFLATLNSTNQTWTGGKEKSRFSAAIVLRSNLSYYTVPLLFQSPMGVTSTFPLKNDKGTFIGILSWPLRDNEQSKLMLLGTKGEILKQVELSNRNFVFDPIRSSWNQLLTFSRDGLIQVFNSELEPVKSLKIDGAINQVAFIDVDNDQNEELVIVQTNRLIIYRRDFTNPVFIEIPGLSVQKTYFSVKMQQSKKHLLSVQNENHQYLVSYSKNKWFWLRFVVVFGFALLAYLIFWTLKKIQQLQVDRIKFDNERFYKMQLDLIRNQLDPHFLFNALNSIAFSINKEDRKTAYSNLGLFSKFMREAIVSIDEFSRTLEEELDYVQNYLILEKFRFKEKFSYDFMVSPGINKSIKVPKLIIFSFTESALKKGILSGVSTGKISITIDDANKQGVYISITDDGMHRNLSNSKQAYSKNMMMMEQVVAYFNTFNTKHISIQVLDNGTELKPMGSTVEIFIPAEYNYQL
jgi:hypothetical protein